MLGADGTVTEHALPCKDQRQQAIVVGPDGNVWFTERANKVGRVDTNAAGK